VQVVTGEAAADQRGRSDLLQGWCRRLLAPVITRRPAALLPGQPAALPDPPQRTAAQRVDATISPARSQAVRELRGHNHRSHDPASGPAPVLRELGRGSCGL